MVGLAEHWAQFSTCKRRHVGAVLFHPDTKAVLSVGYNDTPIGQLDCGDGGCEPCDGPMATSLILACRCIHAEEQTIAFAARYGHASQGAWIAATHTPCSSCRKLLIQAGVVKVVLDGKTLALEG